MHVSLDPGHTSKLVARPGRCNRGQEMTEASRNTCIVKTGEKKSNTIPELIKMPRGGREKSNLTGKLLSCEMEKTGGIVLASSSWERGEGVVRAR